MVTSMKSIKADKKKADTKTKKTYTKSKNDINAIHGELGTYLKGMTGGIKADYNSAQTSTKAATAALKARMLADSKINKAEATQEQDRLGLGSVGMGSFDQDAAFSGQVADRSGEDFLANLRMNQVNAGSVASLQEGANKGQQSSALGLYKNRYNDEMDANKEAYDTMSTKFKEEEAAKKAAEAKFKAQQRAFQRSSFTPYSRGGYSRRPFVPYGRGGGGYTAPSRGIVNNKIGKFHVPKAGWAPQWNKPASRNKKSTMWTRFQTQIGNHVATKRYNQMKN